MKLSKADYITLLNGVCGFLSIAFTIEGQYLAAFLLILLGYVFDILDGLVAKFFKEKSELGGELDSLCDAISFIVAGPLLVYKVIFSQLGVWGMLVCSTVTVCGVLRLARFNISSSEKFFDGVPTTSAGTLLSALALSGLIQSIPIFALITIVVSLLMISKIKYPSFKSFNEKIFVIVLFVGSFVVSILSGQNFEKTISIFISAIMALYTFVSPVLLIRGGKK